MEQGHAAATGARSLGQQARRGFVTALGVSAVIVAVIGSIAWGLRVRAALQYPYSLVYTDGNAANWAAWAPDLPLYAPVDTPPLVHFAYMPLYQGLVAAFGVLGHTDLPSLRLISVVPMLLTALVVCAVVRRREGGWVFPALAAALCLTWPATFATVIHVRPEFMGALFGACGIARLRPTRAGIAEATVWFALAALSKQTFVFAGVAAGLWLLLRDRRMAVSYAISMTVVGGILFGGVMWMSHGWFWWHAVLAQRNAWHATTTLEWYASYLPYVIAPVLLAASQAWREFRDGAVSPWSVYFLVSWAVTATIGKVGAELGYFVEPAAPTIVLASTALARLVRSGALPRLVLAAALVIVTVAGVYAKPGPTARYRRGDVPGAPHALAESMLEDRVRALPGEVLCADQSLVVRAGKRSWFQPFMFTILAREGAWDEQPFLQEVATGRYTTVLLPLSVEQCMAFPGADMFFSPAFLRTVQQHFVLAEVITDEQGRPWWHRYVWSR